MNSSSNRGAAGTPIKRRLPVPGNPNRLLALLRIIRKTSNEATMEQMARKLNATAKSAGRAPLAIFAKGTVNDIETGVIQIKYAHLEAYGLAINLPTWVLLLLSRIRGNELEAELKVAQFVVSVLSGLIAGQEDINNYPSILSEQLTAEFGDINEYTKVIITQEMYRKLLKSGRQEEMGRLSQLARRQPQADFYCRKDGTNTVIPEGGLFAQERKGARRLLNLRNMQKRQPRP